MLELALWIAVGVTTSAMICAITTSKITLRQALRKTFVPVSWREFVLPPCPLCWAARAAMLLATVVTATTLVS